MLVLHEGRKTALHSLSMVVQLVNGEGGVFLDIRDAGDFASDTSLMHYIPPPLFRSLRGGEVLNKPIVVVCGPIRRGPPRHCARRFRSVAKLAGGMMEWDAQRLPVVTQ